MKKQSKTVRVNREILNNLILDIYQDNWEISNCIVTKKTAQELWARYIKKIRKLFIK